MKKILAITFMITNFAGLSQANQSFPVIGGQSYSQSGASSSYSATGPKGPQFTGRENLLRRIEEQSGIKKASPIQCESRSFGQSEPAMSFFKDIEDHMNCNEKTTVETLCNCVAELQAMDSGAYPAVAHLNTDYKSLVKKAIAKNLADQLILSEGEKELNSIMVMDSLYNDSSCELVPEGKIGQDDRNIVFDSYIDSKITKASRKMNSLYGGEKAAMSMALDAEFLKVLSSSIDFDKTLSGPKMRKDVLKGIKETLERNPTFKDKFSQSPLYAKLAKGNSKAKNTLAEMVETIKIKPRQRQNRNTAYGDVVKNFMQNYSKDTCEKLNDDIKNLYQAGFNNKVEEEYFKLFLKDDPAALISYQDLYGEDLLGHFMKGEPSQYASREQDLAEAEYSMNVFYCEEFDNLQNMNTKVDVASDEVQEKVEENTDITEKLSKVNLNIANLEVARNRAQENLAGIRLQREHLTNLSAAYKALIDGSATYEEDGKTYIDPEAIKLISPEADLGITQDKEGRYLLPSADILISSLESNELKIKGLNYTEAYQGRALSTANVNLLTEYEKRDELTNKLNENNRVISDNGLNPAALNVLTGAVTATYTTNSDGIYRNDISYGPTRVSTPTSNKKSNSFKRSDDAVASNFNNYDTNVNEVSSDLPSISPAVSSAGIKTTNITNNTTTSDDSRDLIGPRLPTSNRAEIDTRGPVTRRDVSLRDASPARRAVARLEGRVEEQERIVEEFTPNTTEQEFIGARTPEHSAALAELDKLKKELELEKLKAKLEAERRTLAEAQATPAAAKAVTDNNTTRSVGFATPKPTATFSNAAQPSRVSSNIASAPSGGIDVPSQGQSNPVVAVNAASEGLKAVNNLELNNTRTLASVGDGSGNAGFSLTALNSFEGTGDNRVVKLETNLADIPAGEKEQFIRELFKKGESELVLELPSGEKILVSNNEFIGPRVPASVDASFIGPRRPESELPKAGAAAAHQGLKDLIDSSKDL